jgi:hypothetical protein
MGLPGINITEKENLIGNKDHLYNKYGVIVNRDTDGVYLSGTFFGDEKLLE